jgi:hypothetical protein
MLGVYEEFTDRHSGTHDDDSIADSTSYQSEVISHTQHQLQSPVLHRVDITSIRQRTNEPITQEYSSPIRRQRRWLSHVIPDSPVADGAKPAAPQSSPSQSTVPPLGSTQVRQEYLLGRVCFLLQPIQDSPDISERELIEGLVPDSLGDLLSIFPINRRNISASSVSSGSDTS